MAENQKIDESQKENILLPYTLEVVEILREIERYVRGRYMERKNSMDLKSLDPQQDIEIIIEIPEIEYKKKDEKEGKKEDGKKDKNEQIKEKSCFFKLLEKIKDHCDLSEFSKELEIGDDILYTMIVILILGRILGYDGKKLWGDIFKMVVTETEENTVIDQPFYQFKFSRDHKIKLVIKDYIAIPRDFVAAYFGYDTGIDGLNQLIYGGFLLPPDRSAYISISGEAGIGKTALVVRLITAFFQNYNFKNVHYSYKQGDTDQINKDDAQPLSIHYILMEQHEKNIIRLIKECQLINENNKNVQPILKKEKEKKVTEKVIRDIIHFEKSDMFSPMGLIEKIESIENPRNDQNKKQRKVIVIDSVNAIQEMDIKRTEWRELFQSIKAITRNGNTIVFFIVEKKSEEPDFVIEYLSDVVIKLYRDYKEEAFYRVFELVESRFQRTISGKHNFYITKPDSGFIRVYPSTTAMGELLPHRKRVKPTDPKEKENRKEVGIKIDGIIHFFRYSHLFQTKMEPFFQKNSISMFIGDRGAHKSAFAKKFALSAFRDERWETPTNYIVEIDYREQEPNKPLEELLTLGFWNATPREKSISLLLYFSENYDEDPENDIIWETYFGKVIIPGCKGEGKNYIGHISHIVCLYEVKDYTEDVYIYQLDELIRAIESCEAKDEIRGKEKDKIPGSYYDFINRKSISRIHRITEAEVASNPINFNPFNILYEGNYIKNSKINRELIDRFIEQEIRIMNFQPDEIDELKKKNQQLLEDINKYKDPAKKEKIKRISKYVENLFNIPIKEYYASLILINKVTPLKRVRGPLIAQLKKICPNNIDQTKKSIDFLVEVSQSLDGVIDEFHDKDKKNILKEMEFFNLLEKLIHRIDFVRRMLFFLALRFTNYPENFKIKKFNKEKYLEKFATASKLFNMELLNPDKIRANGDKKFNESTFNYNDKSVEKVKVSRIILDDAENLDKVYKSLNPPKYISTLAHLCLAKEITLGIVNTRSQDETSEVDTVCNAVSDNAFQFDKFFFKGEMYTTFIIIRSATSVHNNMRYYLSKRDDGLLQLNNTFALLSNVGKQNPEPIEIRLFLPDLSNEFSKSMYRVLLNRDRILNKNLETDGINDKKEDNKKKEDAENNQDGLKDFARRIDYASEFKVTEEKGLETIYNRQEPFPSIYKEWHDFLKDMITYSLAHTKVNVCTANDPFTDISIILDDESAKDAISILCLPGYLMDLYEKNLASISDYVNFRGNEDYQPVWTHLKDEDRWITFAGENDKEKVKLGNEFYYLHKAAIRVPNISPNIGAHGSNHNNHKDTWKHNWIVPEILFNPAIARDETTNQVIIKEYKDLQYMDIKGYPYYIDPRVDLVFSTEKKEVENKNEGKKEKQSEKDNEESIPDYFVHNDAHDFVALFFELWFKIALEEKKDDNKNCTRDHDNRHCRQYCYFCFFERATKPKNEVYIRELVEKFVKHVKKSVLFNSQGLAKNINRLFNNDEDSGEKEIVLREWYSSAQQKLKVIEPLLMNLGKKVHVRLEIPKYFLYTTWYLAIPLNSPRKDMASEIIIKMTEPHDLAHHQISGIGLQLDERFYDEKMKKFYPEYNYSEVKNAMENLTEHKDKNENEDQFQKVGIPIASNHCYFENLTLLGGFLGDFYRHYKNSVSTDKNFPRKLDDPGIEKITKEDNDNIEQLTEKLKKFSTNFKNWQREDRQRCDSCYMTYLLCQYKRRIDKKPDNNKGGVTTPKKKVKSRK